MSRVRWVLLGAGVLCAMTAGGAQLRAQGRFVAVTHDTVAALPGLQVITIRDAVRESCYVLFVIENAPPGISGNRGEPPALAAAAAVRDARLQQLSAEFERMQYPIAAGIPQNPLKFLWEGQKVQNDFERAFLEREFALLEDLVAQIGAGPRLAVSGPAPCTAPPPTKSPEP